MHYWPLSLFSVYAMFCFLSAIPPSTLIGKVSLVFFVCLFCCICSSYLSWKLIFFNREEIIISNKCYKTLERWLLIYGSCCMLRKRPNAVWHSRAAIIPQVGAHQISQAAHGLESALGQGHCQAEECRRALWSWRFWPDSRVEATKRQSPAQQKELGPET